MSASVGFRVVIVADTAVADGGAAEVAISTALLLAGHGVEVHFFAGGADVDPRLERARIPTTLTGQPQLLADPNRLAATVRGLWNPAAAKLLRSLLRAFPAEKVTVVHVHTWTKCLSPAIWPVLREAPTPTVITLHDYFWVCPNGGFFNYQKSAICDLVPLSGRCIATNCDSRRYAHKLWRVARQAIHNGFASRVNADFICVSKFSASVLRPFLGPDAQLWVIENPLDVPENPPAVIDGEAPLVFVGRISPEKGWRVFAQAASAIGERAVFVGDGPDRGALLAEFPQFHVTGWKTRTEVMSIIRGARALVFPSLWYETQGLVALEAMSQGIPIIVSDGIATTDMVKHGLNGLIFRRGDVASLQATLVRLADEQFVRKLGDGAFNEYWQGVRAQEGYLARLIPVYESAIARMKAPVAMSS